MNNLIVFVELHLFVRPILKSYIPTTLLIAAKRNTYSELVLSVTHSWLYCLSIWLFLWLMANYCHSTLAWLRDRVRGRHHRAYSLAWLRAAGSSICNKANFGSPLTRGRHHRAFYYNYARPTFVFVRSVVFLKAASKPLITVVNTTYFRRFLFTPYLFG